MLHAGIRYSRLERGAISGDARGLIRSVSDRQGWPTGGPSRICVDLHVARDEIVRAPAPASREGRRNRQVPGRTSAAEHWRSPQANGHSRCVCFPATRARFARIARHAARIGAIGVSLRHPLAGRPADQVDGCMCGRGIARVGRASRSIAISGMACLLQRGFRYWKQAASSSSAGTL